MEEYAIVLLGERAPFSADVIDRRLPIHHDMRPESQQARKCLYTQKRDLLMKIAVTREGG